MPFNVCALALCSKSSESTGSGQEYLLAVLGISVLSLVGAAGLAKYVHQPGHRHAADAKDFQRDQAGRRSVHEAAKPTILASPASGIIIYLGYWLGKDDSSWPGA